ncbi:MAG: hypothetical protein RBT70_08740 [Alphaproteobacteria bacterium]|jgi:membrane protein implicated in regulation of membrane protease activity|nr:hypothetical protein [Alphaproteobacteria bacterium]
MEQAIAAGLGAIIEQGALFAFMVIVLIWMRKDNLRLVERMQDKEDEREKQSGLQIERLVTVVQQNTAAWEKVDAKLEKH